MSMPMPLIGPLAVLLVATWGGVAAAQSSLPGAGSIDLSQAWAPRAPMMGQTGSGHGPAGGAGNGAVDVLIENRGSEPDALLSASSDAAAIIVQRPPEPGWPRLRWRLGRVLQD